MSDQRRCLDVLEQISALGVEISVDDFGTGQSSLAQLRNLPADELKIDRSFVKGMAEDPLDAEIVRARSSGWAARMGLRVVAEGIETTRSATCSRASAATSPRASASAARCRRARWPTSSAAVAGTRRSPSVRA